MKVLLAYTVTAVLDIQETGDGTALIQMLEPKVSDNCLIPMCTDPEEARDLVIIAQAHMLEYLVKGAIERRNEIGEAEPELMVRTSPHGDA